MINDEMHTTGTNNRFNVIKHNIMDNHTLKHIGQVINLVKKQLWLYNRYV